MGMTTAHQQQQELLPRLEQQQQQLQQQLQLPARHTTAARRLPSSFELFISAAVSGLITKTACAPMDRLRLLYQVQGMLQQTQQHQQQQQQQQQYGQHQRHRTALKQGNSPWRLSQGLPVNNKDFLPEGIAQVNNSYKYTKYKGIISGLRLVIQEEGFRGLWRGNGVNAVRAAACYAIKFPANDLAKRALTTSSSSNSSSSSSSSNSGSGSGSRANVGSLLLAGALAGSLQKTLSYPLDFLSVRIAVGINADRLGKHHVAGAAAAAAPSSSSISSCNSSCTSNGGANSPYTSKNSNVTGHNSSSGSISISNSSSSRSRKGYNGVVDCARRVWRLEGPLGFFKGYSVALLSGVPYVMLQMAFFDLSQRTLGDAAQRRSAGSSWPLVLLTAGVSGSAANMSAQAIVFPFDTIRKRLMNDGIDGRPKLYRSTWHCLRQIKQTEGLRALYFGIWPATLRSLPAGAIQFACYEFMKEFFLMRAAQTESP